MTRTAKWAAACAIALATSHANDLRAQARHQDLPRSVRSLAGVTLNVDSAASIRSTLGATREREVGEGDDRYVSWCYLPSADSTSLLELMSLTGEMGTSGRALNVIRLRESAPAADRQGCAPLDVSSSPLSAGGLRLGATRRQIRSLLGPPARVSADSVIYEFEAKEDMRPGSAAYLEWNTPERRKSCFEGRAPYLNVSAGVIVLLREERAVEIRLERYDQATC